MGLQKDNCHTQCPSGRREVHSCYVCTNSLISGSSGPLTIIDQDQDQEPQGSSQDEGRSCQVSWIYKGQIRVLTSSGGTIFPVAPQGNARYWIYVRNHINALSLSEFCSRDGTTVRMTHTQKKVRGTHYHLSIPST